MLGGTHVTSILYQRAVRTGFGGRRGAIPECAQRPPPSDTGPTRGARFLRCAALTCVVQFRHLAKLGHHFSS